LLGIMLANTSGGKNSYIVASAALVRVTRRRSADA